MLNARNLDITFADARGTRTIALNVPQLDLAGHGLVAVAGPSGCGKSTLLYTLGGLLQPPQAEINWNGQDILKLPPAKRDAWRRANIGFVFQDFRLIPELSALDNVTLPLRFEQSRISAAQTSHARELLTRFNVPLARESVAVLSRGEAQRVAIARALLHDPPIVMADEPTASLDAKSAGDVIAALKMLAQSRLVLCVTHDRDLIAVADQVLTLEHGRLAEGPEA